jgi:hypothetical protein
MTQPSVDELHAHSITRFDGDASLVSREPSAPGGVLHFYFPSIYGRQSTVLPIDLPPRWTRAGDYILSSTIDHSAKWANAVAKAIGKVASLDWTVRDVAGSEQRTDRARSLLLNANKGKGWINFLTQFLTDYALTNNGGFCEVIWSTLEVRRGRNGQLQPVGRPLGIQHLDSVRCTRMHDVDLYPYRETLAAYWNIRPDEVHAGNFPVMYYDLWGRYHLLWRWQVGATSDLTSPRSELRGTGICAAHRVYQTIFKDASMERYLAEKITGSQPKEIHLVSGIMQSQFEAAMASSQDQARSRNQQQYRGVVVIPGIKPDAGITGHRIPIAEIPDGFEPQQEREDTRLEYANALGLPSRDLQPAPAGLNSGRTAEVEAEQAEDTGFSRFLKWWVHWAGSNLLPQTVEFVWEGESLSDKKAKAEVFDMRAKALTTLVEKGVLSAGQALQIMVDEELIPREFLPADDTTPQDELRDDEKPLEEGEAESVRVAETPATEPSLRDVLSGLKAPAVNPSESGYAEEGGPGTPHAVKADPAGGEITEDEISAIYDDALRWAEAALQRSEV